MTRLFRFRALLAAAVLIVCTWPLAAAPGFWQAATQADFLKGDIDQLSVDQHGRVTLGPEVKKIFDGAVPVVWAMSTAADGSTYLGTGNDGKVFKVAADGTGTLFYDSPELEVHALAPAPNGGLYVATSPDGRIYRVDARGEATPFFDPEDKYIWALATDRTGVVYAATGDKGVVYRITREGKGEPYFTTKSTHAMSLTVEPSGALLVGTAGPGRVFRVSAANKGFLVLDTPYQEVRTMRLDAAGMIYVAALSGKPASGGSSDTTESSPTPTTPATPSVSSEVLSFAVIDVQVSGQSSPSASTGSSASANSGAVYRILPDGLYDLIWEAKDDSPYDVALEPDGAVLVATGDKGKIYRLAGEPVAPVLVTSVQAQHATTMVRLGERTLLATANPGLLVSMSNTRATRGTYDSEVKDAKVVASWGSISWRAVTPGGARVEIFTRAGNTKTPDDTWSDWSGPYGAAEGSPIGSPKARYLQWRAVLTGGTATPMLTSVSAAYLQRNIRPRVESITVHPAGVAFQKPFSTGETEIAGYDEEPAERKLANQGAGASAQTGAPTLGRRIYQRGLQTLAWKAEDDNGDDLTYSVLYRREGETSWRTLKSGLTDTLTVWDTSSTPNGTYVVKVVASDAAAHPAEETLAGELESASFDIDNTPPVVTVGTVTRDGARYVVSVEIRDADSPLTRVEYSLDSQKWQVAYPRDGMLDARREQFEIRFDGEAAGRVLVVRATDALNNVGAGQAGVPK
jgi:hypothetical protein